MRLIGFIFAEDEEEGSGAIFVVVSIIYVFTMVFAVVPLWLIFANNFLIPKLGWFFLASEWGCGIFVIFVTIILIVCSAITGSKLIVILIWAVLNWGLFILSNKWDLYPFLTSKAASAGYSSLADLRVYTANESLVLSDGTVIPEKTQLLINDVKSESYTKTINGVYVINGGFNPFSITVTKDDHSLSGENVTKKNAGDFYSIREFKKLIDSIYQKHSKGFILELSEKGLFPKTHEQDAFFKEELEKNGGVIIKGNWFGHDFNSTEDAFYYFESKGDYSAFKKIYKSNLNEFNIDCYETTSSIGKAFASFGI